MEQWRDDNGSLISAGVAFYSLLSLIPAIAAVAGVYALTVGPTNPNLPGSAMLDVLPGQLRSLVIQHLDTMRHASAGGLSLGALVAVIVSLWSASAAVRHLVVAVNVAQTGRERRSYLRLRLLGLALTVGLVVFLVVALGLTTSLPRLLERANVPVGWERAVSLLRWPVLAATMLLVAAVLYRVAPDEPRRFRYLTPGTATAAGVWIVSSVVFSSFAASAGRYQSSYGVLATAVVSLLWFWLFAASLLLGAEVDAVERRRSGGPERPR